MATNTNDTQKTSSPRRRPGSSSLNFLDSGLRRNDESSTDRHFAKAAERMRQFIQQRAVSTELDIKALIEAGRN